MTFFYNLNDKLNAIREKPETTHKQLNEGAVAEAGYSAKAARAGKDIGKPGKQFAKIAKSAGERYGSKERGEKVAGAVLNKLRHPKESIEDRIGDLDQSNPVNQPAYQRKAKSGDSAQAARGMPKKEGVDKAAFAKLAPPKDKITFADKIAGAKKEVDEMLGDVAAEAIKGALSPKQKKLDKNNNGKLDANDFAMLRKGGKQETDEGWDEMEKDVKHRMSARKVGDITHGAKHDVEEIPGGRRVTRRVDPNTGHSVGADDEDTRNTSGEKRGRGRPKGAKKSLGAKGPSGRSKLMTKEGDFGPMEEGAGEGEDLVKLAKVIQSCRTMDQLEAARKMAQNFLRKHQTNDIAFYGPDMKRKMAAVSDIERKKAELQGGEELDEKAVSKKQQRFMGMVHATQKGEKAPSKEVAKVAKSMKKSDAEDFASTKHKGLPEKKKPEGKKKEKTEEAGGTGTPTASSGFGYGKGIYDSMNRELESMISESMNISMNMNTDANGGPSKSLTVTATDDDAMKLSDLLKNAGLGGGDHIPNVEGGADLDHPGAIEVHGTMDADGANDLADQIRQAIGAHDHEHSGEVCDACGQEDCGCEEMDESYGDEVVDQNYPDYPTNTETSADALQYAGGLNKPKTDVAGDGQTTVPNTAVHTQDEDALRRLREMAGIREAKKPDFTDVDNDGDEKESWEKAEKDKKVDESILASTANLWKEYKGHYGV